MCLVGFRPVAVVCLFASCSRWVLGARPLWVQRVAVGFSPCVFLRCVCLPVAVALARLVSFCSVSRLVWFAFRSAHATYNASPIGRTANTKK